ncbi:DUF6274 family protein [Streptomyces sp. NPDC088725]|uniref:DUF6274 family protein n=1 Tax=Streptomyces sp. NPDC088725 TaxID=3365873 RepID=UPI00380AEDB5
MRHAVRHETGALLRAHLAAASGYRHATSVCPVCHRLQRLAMEPGQALAWPRNTDGPARSCDTDDEETADAEHS